MDCDDDLGYSDMEYSYEDEDDGAYALGPVSFGDARPVSESVLESEAQDVCDRFGPDRASFCQAEAADRVRYGPAFDGFVYFFFPTRGGPLEGKRDLCRIWGFDPDEPVAVRFCHYSVVNDVLISRRDYAVAVYQGDEPPSISLHTTGNDDSGETSSQESSGDDDTSNTGATDADASTGVDESRETSSKKDSEGADASDPGALEVEVQVVESLRRIPFRIGGQIKAITEEYLLGSGGGTKKRCERCTYLNPPDCRSCQMCEGTHLNQVRDGSLLVQLYDYLNNKIPQLHRFCINCDKAHPPGGVQPAMPCVCQRELCQYSLTEYGIGQMSADDLMLYAEVVDLLLAMTRAAATSSRNEAILQPLPLVFLDKEKAFDPENPDYDKLREVVGKLPSMQQISGAKDEHQLKENCKQGGDLVYGLLQWILTSCPARIVSLQGNHRLRSMGTPYQFLIQSASPEHEESFANAKKAHGSTFAFHGSPIENWHRILREGIKNVSGTPLQLHGASYGSGVYLSSQASTSLGYSKVQGGSSLPSQAADLSANIFIADKKVHIMALCEVIDDGVNRNGAIWVVPNDKHVIVRFLFVFVPSSPNFGEAFSAASRCNTTNDAFRNEILAVYQQIMDAGMY